MSHRFLQVHTLTSYPASLLNRDDAGFAKRMPFGGAIRTRISSQCLKRHWRTHDGAHSLKLVDAPESIRSRELFEDFVVKPLVSDGADVALARAAARKVANVVFGSEAKKQKATRQGGKRRAGASDVVAPDDERVATKQVAVLGRPELDYLCGLARQAIKDAGPDVAKVEANLATKLKSKALKANIAALMPGSLVAGLSAALFGRMVTGDILSRTDAAIHVAHALTVHAQMTESDYFSAIDDLIRDDGEQESGHINASELTSGLYYGYVVVDIGGLTGNVGGNSVLAADVVHRLLNIVATVSPGAKLGSTAPYAYSHLVVCEAGSAQPRTLQNAFVEPVRTTGNVVENAYRALADHLTDLDQMYGKQEVRAHSGLRSSAYFENHMPIAQLAEWARKAVA